MVECSPEFSQYLSQNFPNTFVAAIFAGEIGVKSVASEQALGICTFWQSGLPDYTCSEWIISFIEALLKYGVIVDAECHLHACQNFLIWILLKSCTHMTLWSCLWEFTEWPSRLHLQFPCVSESLLKFRVIEASLKYGDIAIFIINAHCHFHACQNFLVWILLLRYTHTCHCGLGRTHYWCPWIDLFCHSAQYEE